MKDLIRLWYQQVHIRPDVGTRGCPVNRKYIILAVTLSVIILCDQVTKMYVGSAMYLNESVEVVKGLFNITYVRNP